MPVTSNPLGNLNGGAPAPTPGPEASPVNNINDAIKTVDSSIKSLEKLVDKIEAAGQDPSNVQAQLAAAKGLHQNYQAIAANQYKSVLSGHDIDESIKKKALQSLGSVARSVEKTSDAQAVADILAGRSPTIASNPLKQVLVDFKKARAEQKAQDPFQQLLKQSSFSGLRKSGGEILSDGRKAYDFTPEDSISAFGVNSQTKGGYVGLMNKVSRGGDFADSGLGEFTGAVTSHPYVKIAAAIGKYVVKPLAEQYASGDILDSASSSLRANIGDEQMNFQLKNMGLRGSSVYEKQMDIYRTAKKQVDLFNNSSLSAPSWITDKVNETRSMTVNNAKNAALMQQRYGIDATQFETDKFKSQANEALYGTKNWYEKVWTNTGERISGTMEADITKKAAELAQDREKSVMEERQRWEEVQNNNPTHRMNTYQNISHLRAVEENTYLRDLDWNKI